MHQKETYQEDFLKWGEVGEVILEFLGHSLLIIKLTWGFFFPQIGNLTLRPPHFPYN